MTNSPSENDDGLAPSVAPTLQMTRRGLVLSLLGMVGVGLTVYAMFPESIGGKSLPVKVWLDKQPVEVRDGSGAIMTDVVVLTNDSDRTIPRISLDVNGQYLLFREDALEVGEQLVLPLEVFTDKRNNSRFDPREKFVEDVVVTGQLANGARGISKFEFHEGETEPYRSNR